MSFFENFPYTNLHELNLDWLIKELQTVKDSAVISVNGQTGEVILYQEPDIEFPSTANGGWDMVRKVDGTIAAGIRFTSEGIAYLITGPQVRQLYDANHQPPYPVTSVNGQTGEVVITSPVTSVNGKTGDIVLYQDQHIQLPSLTDQQMQNWNFYRYVNSVLHGIQFDNDGRAYIMNGSARYQIYTDNNAQPFTFVDNVNAGVMKISQSAPAGVWGFLRETDSGTAGIVFSYDTAIPTAYLRYVDANEVTHDIKLLTPSDIPSSSGVVSINGLTGVVLLNGSNLPSASGVSTTIADVLSTLSQNISGVANNQGLLTNLTTTDKTSLVNAINEVDSHADVNASAITDLSNEVGSVMGDVAIVINGSTASQNVTTGQFVMVRNSTITGITDGLYTSTSNIPSGSIFTQADLIAETSGGLNTLFDQIANIAKVKTISLTFNSSGYCDKTYTDFGYSSGDFIFFPSQFVGSANRSYVARDVSNSTIRVYGFTEFNYTTPITSGTETVKFILFKA